MAKTVAKKKVKAPEFDGFEFIKSERSAIRCEISEFKGKMYLNIREWYLDGEGEWKPSAKGFTVPLNQAHKFRIRLSKFLRGLDEDGAFEVEADDSDSDD